MDEIKKPLTGIRVLDIACFIAAPHAASIMGEFGADVIKVEHPNGGDPWRRYGTQTELPDQSLAWLNEARNKKSITLNLSKPKGAELFKERIKKMGSWLGGIKQDKSRFNTVKGIRLWTNRAL